MVGPKDGKIALVPESVELKKSNEIKIQTSPACEPAVSSISADGQASLDNFFRKTIVEPSIYFLPKY